jgi:hypothetical protein
MWINKENKNQCNPPEYGYCATEDSLTDNHISNDDINKILYDLYWIKGRLERALIDNKCIRSEFETIPERIDHTIEFVKSLRK